jgi:hypothetical protein
VRGPEPSKRTPAKKACHDDAAAPAAPPPEDCFIRGSCRHDVPQLGSLAPFVIAPSLDGTPVDRGEPVLGTARTVVLGGFDRLDHRPPHLIL